MGLLPEKCVRCGKKRTFTAFEGVPTCYDCEVKIKATREETRSCPVDACTMKKEVVHNIIIDRCTRCGGVWLDKSELEILRQRIHSGDGGNFAIGMLLGMAIG